MYRQELDNLGQKWDKVGTKVGQLLESPPKILRLIDNG